MYTVLLDAGSYNYYRVTATLAWYRHQKDALFPSMQNEVFLEKLRSQYFSCLEKFYKQVKKDLGLNLNNHDVYYIRDSPRETLWRTQIYDGYKSNRDERETKEKTKLANLEGDALQKELGKQPGQYIKYLNETAGQYFKQTVRVSGAEADDCVAVLTKLFLDLNYQKVIVVSIDSDFYQLLEDPRVCIYNPKTWTRVNCPNPLATLNEKILAGDVSDCIKRVSAPYASELYWNQLLFNSQMIDFQYIPREIQSNILQTLTLSVPLHYQDPPIGYGLAHLPPITNPDLAIQFTNIIKYNQDRNISLLVVDANFFKPISHQLQSYDPLLKYMGRSVYRSGQRLIIYLPNLTSDHITILNWYNELLDRMGMLSDCLTVTPFFDIPSHFSGRRLSRLAFISEVPKDIHVPIISNAGLLQTLSPSDSWGSRRPVFSIDNSAYSGTLIKDFNYDLIILGSDHENEMALFKLFNKSPHQVSLKTQSYTLNNDILEDVILDDVILDDPLLDDGILEDEILEDDEIIG